MRRRAALRSATLLVATAFAVGALPARVARAGDVYAPQLDAKAASVVLVKSVLKITFGGGNEQERNDERIGTVIDATGLVLIQSWSFGANIKVNATNIRVFFDGEEKEHAAVLGATDSKLGLAFLRVKDLAGRAIVPVDLANIAEPKVGDELFGVVRTDSGFDYAPYYGTARLVGQVKKPREMWMPNGFAPIGVPLYTAEGRITGIVIRQSGISEEGGGARTFLLPMKQFALVVALASKASQKALDDAKQHEKEAAEEAAKAATESGAAAGDGKTPDTPPKPDAPPKDDKKAPDAPGSPSAPK